MSEEEFREMFNLQKKQRYAVVAENGKTVHKLLKDTIRKLKVSAGLPDWKAYVDFVNNIVVGGLVEVAKVSLEYLNEQLDPDTIVKDDKMPMLELDLELYGKQVVYVPHLASSANADGGIRDLVQGVMAGFIGTASLFKRIDGIEGSYIKELMEIFGEEMKIANIPENSKLFEVSESPELEEGKWRLSTT